MLRKRTRESSAQRQPLPLEWTPALRFMDADNLCEGRRLARLVLTRVRRCRCCKSIYAHIVRALGKRLFLDDDPLRIAQTAGLEGVSLRALSAVILLYGRPRLVLCE